MVSRCTVSPANITLFHIQIYNNNNAAPLQWPRQISSPQSSKSFAHRVLSEYLDFPELKGGASVLHHYRSQEQRNL